MAADSLSGTRLSSSEARTLLSLAREVIRQVAVLIRNSQLHDPENEVFHEPMDRLAATLARILADEAHLDLEVVGTELYANQLRVRMEIRNLQTYRFVAGELNRRRLGGLRFRAVPDRATLARILTVLARHRPADGDDATASLNAALQEAGITGITAVPPREMLAEPPEDRRQRAIETYQQTLDFIRECMTTLSSPADLNLRRAKRHIHKLVDLSFEEGEGFSLAGLAAIKSHNEYTFNHMVNVCVLSIAFGQRLGLARLQLAQLGLCALYHDLGKLNIPLEILEKHGPLSEEEWAVMGHHTLYGARALFPLVANEPAAVERVLETLQHHIGFDGEGYPKLRLLRRQGLFTRMVAIADAFDAMTNKRVYQRKFLPDEAIATMRREAGHKYDPILLKAFVNCMGLYPVGSVVLLSTGEIAVVCESNPEPSLIHRPRVRLVTDPSFVASSPTAPVLDLAQPEHAARQIRTCLDPELVGIDPASYAI